MNCSFKHIIIFLWCIAAQGKIAASGVTCRMTNDSQKGVIAYNHLGLTTSIVQGSDTLSYTYDGTGRRIKKQLNSATPRWYMDGVEYSGDTTIIHTEYGRIRRNAAADPWKWDYFLKDHLGNVRVVLDAGTSTSGATVSSSGGSVTYLATMEENKMAEEDPYFANLNETRVDAPYNYPDKNPLNAKLSKVPGKSKGLSILLRVMAGDTISISAKAFYNMDKTLPGKGVDIVPVVGSAITALTSPTGTVLGEAARLAVDLGAEASQSVALINVPQTVDNNKEAKPKSGINFVLYNNVFDIVEANTGVLPVEERINEIQTLATDNLVIQEAGFLEIFVNNEAQTPVYYDNFMVTMSSGNSAVSEINAYFPFGMIMPGLSLMAPPDKWNGYKYSVKEIQEMTGWYDFGNRMQDPVIGRFMVPDRFAEKYSWLSPYSYAANNPINNIDVNGDYLVIVFGDNQMRVYEFGTTEEEDEEDEFFKSTVRALNQLGSKKFGGQMIGELQNSEFKYNISQSTDGQNTANHNYKNSKMEDGVMKTGADITWTGRSSIDLGHEMGHGWDAMNGYDIRQDPLNILPGDDAPSGEIRAVHIENILRTEQGMGLRTTYFRSETGEPQGKALVNAFGIETRFGYDYKNNSNIPGNYGNGYGLRLIGNPNLIHKNPVLVPVKPPSIRLR